MSITRIIFTLTLTITLASSQLVGCGGGGPGACDTYKTAQDACENTYANATGATPPEHRDL